MESERKPWLGFVVSGVASCAGYALLFAYLNDSEVMSVFMRKDRWYLPVMTAFAFSIAHGAFTGYFWEVLGVRARTAPKKG
jgi:hypothetical protein